MDIPTRHERNHRRLHRQIDALLRRTPRLRAVLHSFIDGPLRFLRIPLALMLIVGGFVGFLPVLGFWMIPLGLLLLAIDLPLLRPAVSGTIIRLRRRLRRALGQGGSLAWLGARLRRHD